jgi:hypothetical protein
MGIFTFKVLSLNVSFDEDGGAGRNGEVACSSDERNAEWARMDFKTIVVHRLSNQRLKETKTLAEPRNL